ncbi:ABC transporter substrate-binding protein [Jiangella alkaliphila]|uniref:ABC transporter substrate-binding protein n=1 Tax=Jiangella alkaliphila TaxID=419479 RepID=UPI00069C3C94|nr:ABC transporter substrate-binding protein [Jiangella alkaliphila]
MAVILAALAIGACSTTSAGDETGSGSGSDEIVASGQFPIENLDPHSPVGGSLGMELVAKHIFSRLVQIDANGQLTGDLAEEWSADDTGTTWTFQLRDSVRFSDGSELTSSDVVASFERLLALESPIAGNFPDVTATAPDATTVTFTAAAPDAALPAKLTAVYVVAEETPATQSAGGQPPVGSGPFVVDEFAPGAEVVLSRNDDYFGGAPSLAKLTFRTIPEIAARLTALRTGEVDVIWGVPDDQMALLRSEESIEIDAVESDATFTMWFNSTTPALADPAVRRAIWQAVDFETIVAQLYPETGTLADAPIAPPVLGHATQEPMVYDPDAARAALAAAGFDFDTVLRLQFQSQFRSFVEAVVSDLAEIGVQVEPLEKEQAVFIEDLLALNWDINMQQIGTAGFDAATNLGRLYPCAAGRNGYCNPELDALLAQAGQTPDPAEREQVYAQASQIIWTDAVGMYPMFVKMSYAWGASVSGFTLDRVGLPDFRDAGVE